MSLIKQLWITVLVILLLPLGGSLAVGLSALRNYTEQEIRVKNIDNVNALALSMSQLDKDSVIIELLMAAQFDTGHYQLIELHAPDGELLARREAAAPVDNVPGWFVDLVRFDVPPSQAVIQNGWQQYGTLTLQSQHSFAYQSLWHGAIRLVAWFGLAALIGLLLAGWIVRTIRKPLKAVIAQARDIGARRFTTSPEPQTRELRQVVQAMNQLSDSVREMLHNESEKLDKLRRRLQQDKATGALGRDAFMTQLTTHLESEDERASGCLVLVRLNRLTDVNQRLGRAPTNKLLKSLSQSLHRVARTQGGGIVGRLNSGDFALLIPGCEDDGSLAEALSAELEALRVGESEASLGLLSALCHYAPGDTISRLMAGLDGALAAAETQGDLGQQWVESQRSDLLYTNRADWRSALERAVAQGPRLASFPVVDAGGSLLHHEGPCFLYLEGEWRAAGTFMPWVSRLELTTSLDLAVAKAAIDTISRDQVPLGITLSPASIRDADFLTRLTELFKGHPEQARLLWLELPKSAALREPEQFRLLCRVLEPLVCRIGLKQVGSEFSRLAELQGSGLSFLKFDRSLVQGIEASPEQQTVLLGMATLCRALGVLTIAEGVASDIERQTVFDLGLDGVTGPGVRL
ncbi:EAL domain-containing protein [Halomonas sp. KAO]|uniref:bifunctional diguanylate cyclase/phosphodiesterase n=1 Tax=Halomonas sp. KAO TaxID=2783858 RepID=UPI0018A06529|nr:LapD/MoxY N-terminal periplasmic domain-containing protein [Halomonas sp. KAO]MBF7052978.1 EAL domain-containing protein [Halomonas sp. KAO]